MTHLLNVEDAEEEEEKNCVNAEHMSQNKIFPVIYLYKKHTIIRILYMHYLTKLVVVVLCFIKFVFVSFFQLKYDIRHITNNLNNFFLNFNTVL